MYYKIKKIIKEEYLPNDIVIATIETDNCGRFETHTIVQAKNVWKKIKNSKEIEL